MKRPDVSLATADQFRAALDRLERGVARNKAKTRVLRFLREYVVEEMNGRPTPADEPDVDPATWECPDCGRKSYRKTAAAARADITRQKNAAGHLALCRCPNIRRPIP